MTDHGLKAIACALIILSMCQTTGTEKEPGEYIKLILCFLFFGFLVGTIYFLVTP